MDAARFESFVRDHSLAIQNLALVLANANCADEQIANCCVEVLENCGAPSLESLANIDKSLKSNDSTQVYWSATLVGRIVQDRELLASMDALDWQNKLVARLEEAGIETFAHERLIWALGQFPRMSETSVRVLQAKRGQANARMTRLIDEALAKSSSVTTPAT